MGLACWGLSWVVTPGVHSSSEQAREWLIKPYRTTPHQIRPKETSVTTLNCRDRELVAIGAALASNCNPCIEYHVAEARKVGLSDAEISEAVALADKIKRVPAGKVMETASRLLTAGEDVAIPAASGCTPGTVPGAKSCC